MRYLATETVPLDTLTPLEGNPRRGRVDAIRESLAVNGQYRSLVVRVQGPTRTILAGNHTHEALVAEGHAEARVELIDCNDDEARRIVLADNKTADGSEYDTDALLAILGDVETAGGLMGTGWDSSEYEALLSAASAAESAALGYGTENPYDYQGEPRTRETPGEFPAFGHDIETAYRCPSCSYEWSGKPK